MEEWDFVDEKELQNWKGARICLTCQHFAYGVDAHCRTMDWPGVTKLHRLRPVDGACSAAE